MNKSQFYDFENPDDINKTLWFSFYDGYMEKLRKWFFQEYAGQEDILNLEIAFEVISKYFRAFFISLYDYDSRWEAIARYFQLSFKDKEIEVNALMYEYLLSEAVKDEDSDDRKSERRLVVIEDRFREISKERGFKALSSLFDYSDFFLENLRGLEQSNSLLQAVSLYSQSKVDEIYKTA